MSIHRALTSLILSAVLLAGVSCGGGGDGGGGGLEPQPATVRSASLDQAQEEPTPPVASSATGRGAVVVNPTTLEITGGITFTGLTGDASAAHIHTGARGVAGPPNVVTLTITDDIGTGTGTATIPANTTLTAAQFADLVAGNLYFNVHTQANQGGEIRGQIDIQGRVTAGLATLNGSQETPPGMSTATGRGTIVFDSTTRDVLVGYVTHNVTNATVAHIHTGAPGVAGPANVVTLSRRGPTLYSAPVPTRLTEQSVADLNAGNTYFNVHSSNDLCPPAPSCAAGEIRGQIEVR